MRKLLVLLTTVAALTSWALLSSMAFDVGPALAVKTQTSGDCTKVKGRITCTTSSTKTSVSSSTSTFSTSSASTSTKVPGEANDKGGNQGGVSKKSTTAATTTFTTAATTTFTTAITGTTTDRGSFNLNNKPQKSSTATTTTTSEVTTTSDSASTSTAAGPCTFNHGHPDGFCH